MKTKRIRTRQEPLFPRWIAMVLIVALCMGAWVAKLYDLQIVRGEDFIKKAERTGVQTVDIDAARGEILDADGNELVVNTIGRNIVFNKAYMRDADMNQVVLRLCKLLEQNGETWKNKFPIYLDEQGEYQFYENRTADIKSIISFCRLQSYATAQNCVDALIKKYECEQYSPADALKIVSVRNQMRAEDYSFKYPYTFATGVSDDTVAVITENRAAFGYVSITNTTERAYLQGDLAPHVVGRVGAINATQYAALKDSGYKLNDVLGQFGIEAALESELRGEFGKREITYSSGGKVTSVVDTVAPQAGNTVYLTIQSDLQRAVQQALQKNIDDVKQKAKGRDSEGANCTGGAAIVMDVRNGAVLAMASAPTFNLATYAQDLGALSTDDVGTPLVNRAVNGTYPPGSVMKPSVALAGLSEGVIGLNETISCTHIYQRFLPEKFRCLGYHGATNVRYGLQVSCNIFFYETGFRLGIDRMNAYCKRLGLGVKTGIEIGEAEGVLAGRAQREAIGSTMGWFPGDTIQAAIGQSDNLFTPVQLASYISTIANGGTRYQAHLVQKVTDYTRTTLVSKDYNADPTVVEDMTDIAPVYYQAVQAGMRQAVLGGSVSSVLSRYPIALAGKTGTAQSGDGADHGLLAVYAPYDDPQICVVMVLEHGGHGYSAATGVRDILDAYFGLNTGDGASAETAIE